MAGWHAAPLAGVGGGQAAKHAIFPLVRWLVNTQHTRLAFLCGNIQNVKTLGVKCVYCHDGVTQHAWDEGLKLYYILYIILYYIYILYIIFFLFCNTYLHTYHVLYPSLDNYNYCIWVQGESNLSFNFCC